MDIDWAKFQKIQNQIKQLEEEALQECVDNGLRDAIVEVMTAKDAVKAEMLIIDMPDSVQKAYIRRRIRQLV